MTIRRIYTVRPIINGKVTAKLEELDTVGTGISKYRDEIKALTNVDGSGGFDILEADGETYKDVYDMLVGIAEVWDQLDDLSQARVSEIFAGQRGFAVFSSIIQNIDDVKAAYEDAMNAAGTAAEANAIVMDTTEKKVEQLKTSFQVLSHDIISSDLTKGIVDFGTAAIDALDNLINKVGALPVALGALTGLEVIKNLGNIFTKLTGVGEYTGAVKGFSVLAKSLSEIGISAASVLGPIGAITAGLVALGAGVSIYEHHLDNMRSAADDASAGVQGMSADIDSQMQRIAELRNQLESENISLSESATIRGELRGIQSELIEAYGLEADSIDLLGDSLDTINEKLGQALGTEAKKAIDENLKFYEEAFDKIENWAKKSNGLSDANGMFMLSGGFGTSNLRNFSDEATAALEQVVAEYNNVSFAANGAGLSITGNAYEAEAALNAIYEAMLNVDTSSFTDGQKRAWDSFKNNIKSGLSEVEGVIEEFGNRYQDYLLNQILADDDARHLMSRATNYVSALNDAIADGDWSGVQEAVQNLLTLEGVDLHGAQIGDELRNYIAQIIQEALNNVPPEATGNGIKGEDWWMRYYGNGLEEGAEKTTQAIKQSFDDIFSTDEGKQLSSDIDDYITGVGKLQSAMESLSDGSLGIEDVVELVEEFPALAKYVDLTSDSFGDLDEGLRRVAQDSPDDLVNKLRELAESGNLTEEAAQAVDVLADSLENISASAVKDVSGEFGVLADSINSAKKAKSDLDKALAIDDWDVGYQGRADAFEQMYGYLESGQYGSAKLSAIKDYFGLAEQSAEATEAWANANLKFFGSFDDDGKFKTFADDQVDGLYAWLEAVEAMNKNGKLDPEVASFDSDTMDFHYSINHLKELADAFGWTEEMARDFIQKYRMYVDEMDWVSRDAWDNWEEFTSQDLVFEIKSNVKEETEDVQNLISQMDGLAQQYNNLTNGNVDYAKRPYLLTDDGFWETTISQGREEYDAGEILYSFEITPILENGEKLTDEALEAYIKEIFDGANGIDEILERDKARESLIIDIKEGSYEDNAEYFEQLNSWLDEIKQKHAALYEQLNSAGTGDAMVASLKTLMDYTGESEESVRSMIGTMNEWRSQAGLEPIKFIEDGQVTITQQIVDNLAAAGMTADEIVDYLADLSENSDVEIEADIKLDDVDISGEVAEKLGGAEDNTVSVTLELDDEQFTIEITAAKDALDETFGEGSEWNAVVNGDTADAQTKMETVISTLNTISEDIVAATVTDNTGAAQSGLSNVLGLLSSVSANSYQVVTVEYKTIGTPPGKTATGTKHAKAGLSLLGDEYSPSGTPKPELVVTKDSAYLAGIHGPTMGYLNEGDIVYTADETKKILGNGDFSDSIPAFAGGVGNGLEKAKSYSSKNYGSPSSYSNYSPTGSTYSSSTAEKDSKEAPWEEELKRYQHMRKMEQMSDDEYYNHLMALLDQYYSVRETYLDDYWSLEEEYYDLGKDLADDWFNDQQHQIDLLSHHRGTQNEQIAMYMEIQAEAHRLADEARARGLDDNDEYIQNLQKTWWDAAGNIKDLIDQTYDEIESRLQNGIDLRQNWIDAQLNYGNFDKAQMYSMEAVQKYEEYQATLHERADYLRNERGLSDDDDEVAALSLEWWEVQRKKIEQQLMVSNAMIDYQDRLINVNSRGQESAIANGDVLAISDSSAKVVQSYKKMQEEILKQEEYYRSLGYDETSEALMELEERYWEYQENIRDAMTSGFEQIVQNANAAVDAIQNCYDVLINGAKEFAENGFITVDTFQQIGNLGLQYMSMLTNENGQLVVNKERINQVTAAKVEELAVDTALNYVHQLEAAVAANDAIALQNLLYATNNATKGTWGLVYAQLAFINLSGAQRMAAMRNIQAYQMLAQSAMSSIGQTAKTAESASNSASSAAEALPELGKDLLDELDDEVQFLLGLLEEGGELIYSWDKALRDAAGVVDDMNLSRIGDLTKEGWATMGLYAQQYMTYMKTAEAYAEKRAELEAKVASDPYNTNYINELQDIVDKQRDVIDNQYKARDAIKDLVEEGIKAELEAVKNLMDMYSDTLDQAKDLYDYQKRVQKQTKTISQLQKQIQANSGDDSEETRKTLQQLKNDLISAQEELEETQYDRYVSDQKKLLSKLYDDYELILNSRLDDIDGLINEVINNVVTHSTEIWSTIEAAAGEVGYQISDATTDIWQSIIASSGNITDTLWWGFDILNTAIGNVVTQLMGYQIAIEGAVEASKEAVKAAMADLASSLDTPTFGEIAQQNADYSKLIKNGIEMQLNSDRWWAAENDATMSKEEKEARQEELHEINVGLAAEISAIDLSTGLSFDDASGEWRWDTNGTKAYEVDSTSTWKSVEELEKKLKEGLEFHTGGIVGGSLGQNERWAKVLDGEGIVPVEQMKGFMDRAKAMNQIVSSANSDSRSSVVNYNIDNLNLPNVHNYEEFMNELKNDKKFKGLVQSVTTDLVAGKSEINKNRFSW